MAIIYSYARLCSRQICSLSASLSASPVSPHWWLDSPCRKWRHVRQTPKVLPFLSCCHDDSSRVSKLRRRSRSLAGRCCAAIRHASSSARSSAVRPASDKVRRTTRRSAPSGCRSTQPRSSRILRLCDTVPLVRPRYSAGIGACCCSGWHPGDSRAWPVEPVASRHRRQLGVARTTWPGTGR